LKQRNKKSQQRKRRHTEEPNRNIWTEKYTNWNLKLNGWSEQQNGAEKIISKCEDRNPEIAQCEKLKKIGLKTWE
jgi:hypothetical protein